MNREALRKLSTKHLGMLESTVDDFLDFVNGEDYCEDGISDYQYDIFEKAMEVFYDKEIWKWIEERIA